MKYRSLELDMTIAKAVNRFAVAGFRISEVVIEELIPTEEHGYVETPFAWYSDWDSLLKDSLRRFPVLEVTYNPENGHLIILTC